MIIIWDVCFHVLEYSLIKEENYIIHRKIPTT